MLHPLVRSIVPIVGDQEQAEYQVQNGEQVELLPFTWTMYTTLHKLIYVPIIWCLRVKAEQFDGSMLAFDGVCSDRFHFEFKKVSSQRTPQTKSSTTETRV